MKKLAPTLIVVLLIFGGFVGLREMLVGQPRGVRVLSVSGGDGEIAWIHTSTNVANWERFVTSIHRIPGIEVDDSGAFLDSTTSVPEVNIGFPGLSGRLRVRWYKLTSEISTQKIVDALAEREPPPLALIGGGSTDRALDLALALNQRTDWKGERPLLMLTTATANEVLLDDDPSAPTSVLGIRKARHLMKVYEGRTYRFCFTNEQMANAVVDFLWQQPDLKPTGSEDSPPRVFILAWDDDPYSLDLSEHFRKRLHNSAKPIRIVKDIVHFSVGTFDRANRKEAEFAEQILADLPTKSGQRSLLVLPTVGPPARRVLKALVGEFPMIGQHLVAVNGDGIGFNLFYRDADIAWPMRDLPVPFVFFMHQNPVAWDEEPNPKKLKPEAEDRLQLLPPNSTEDVLLYTELMEHVCRAVVEEDHLVADSVELAKALRTTAPDFFDADGDRQTGSGEYIVWVKPIFRGRDRIASSSIIEVWNRRDGKTWQRVKELSR